MLNLHCLRKRIKKKRASLNSNINSPMQRLIGCLYKIGSNNRKGGKVLLKNVIQQQGGNVY